MLRDQYKPLDLFERVPQLDRLLLYDQIVPVSAVEAL